MRITVSSGDRTIDVRTEPHEHVTLQDMEQTALRMLNAVPPPEPEPQPAFGFALSSDTQLAPDPEPAYDTEEDDD